MAATATAAARRRARNGLLDTCSIYAFALVLAALSLSFTAAQDPPPTTPAPTVPDPITEEWIKVYLENKYEPEATRMCNMLNNADWNYETDINDKTQDELETATLTYASFEKEQWTAVFSKTNTSGFVDEDLIRQLDSLKVLGIPALEEDDIRKLTTSTTNMTGIYATAKICPYNKRDNCTEDEKLSLDPGIEGVLSTSRDYDELAYVWQAWRDETGKRMKSNYQLYVELSNKAAERNGFPDMGDMWRHDYDSETLREDMEKLWATISPLYEELHKYVGRKLQEEYPQLNTSSGVLPAHIFGNMWAQSWVNIFDIVKPFPNASAVDVTQSLLNQSYTAKKMFETSNDFYKSLGLEDNSISYNEHAMIEKPNDKEVVCHASAWDFCNKTDFRIKMCTKINMEDFVTIHHEMGHIQYFILYKDRPYVFRKGANPGFHEAVGDTIALSVSTPKHLKEVGLLDPDYPDSYEDNINSLMSMALEKVAFLPFGLLIDMWRWDVFAGNVTEDQWNEHWWDLRRTIQRVEPPVPRGEDDFDPGAKFHVPGDSQYIAYFIAHILQFQFHKALCEAAGEYNPNNVSQPLHKCDIYRSTEAGALLRKGLELGGSTSWEDALEAITGQRKYSGEALMEYFQPLYEYLQEENEAAENGGNEGGGNGGGGNGGGGNGGGGSGGGGNGGGGSGGGGDGEEGSEKVSQTIPIVVGSVIGGILVVALVGYVVMRNRSKKRSVSVISGTAGSKNLP